MNVWALMKQTIREQVRKIQGRTNLKCSRCENEILSNVRLTHEFKKILRDSVFGSGYIDTKIDIRQSVYQLPTSDLNGFFELGLFFAGNANNYLVFRRSRELVDEWTITSLYTQYSLSDLFEFVGCKCIEVSTEKDERITTSDRPILSLFEIGSMINNAIENKSVNCYVSRSPGSM